MNTYITSDTHFGHTNVIKYCNRPFDNADQMDAELIRRWNNTVAKNDIVWHLGDFSLFRNAEKLRNYFSQLNGRINLVLGNHDTKPAKFYYDIGFNRVYDKPVVFSERFILSHEPIRLPIPSVSTFFVNLFGHVHDSKDYQTFTRNRACLCVERWNYTPVKLSEIIERFN